MVWALFEYQVEATGFIALLAALITFTAGALMVVNIRYYSFKDLDLKNRVPFIVMILVVLAFVIVSWDPPIVLFTMAILYAASGPVMAVYARREKFMKAARFDALSRQKAANSEEHETPIAPVKPDLDAGDQNR
jgi:CDP-diacylglycerol--serine O-phosphatidyltransferase